METEGAGKGVESKRLVDKIWNLEAEKESLRKENESLKKKVGNKQVEIHELRRRADSFGNYGKLASTEGEQSNDGSPTNTSNEPMQFMQKTLERVSADKDAIYSEKKQLEEQLEKKENELKLHESKVAKLLLEQKGLYQEKRISQKIMLDREEEIKRLVFKLWQLLDDLTSGTIELGSPAKKSTAKHQKILLLQERVQNLMSDMNVITEAKDKKDETRKRTDSNASHSEDGKPSMSTSKSSETAEEKPAVSAFIKKFETSNKSDKEDSSNSTIVLQLNNKIEILQAENNRLLQDKRSMAYDLSQRMEEINNLKQRDLSINNHDDNFDGAQLGEEFNSGFITDTNKNKSRLPLQTAQIQLPNSSDLISGEEAPLFPSRKETILQKYCCCCSIL
ncbi:uncharacterized protein TRIADDRAFT_55063 [Trichoplax adhaerens]|uniref:Uncharacterized protein n=1 Tax=Trichoplax adhaerens TaxID=10228 RepID=B3RQP3_TRIAD|nr:predicted protein [Trichoplax adhaerens]EDV27282.1 predicted protein [Trichoplax adhaerens]|eukprot:XP_002111278.1 predicted protein [Trichoplax adhaerens]